MEATLKGREARVESVLDDLRILVGAEHVAVGPGAADPFLRVGEEAPGLAVVRPDSTEDVQEIVNLAREKGVSILTCNDRYLLPEDLDRNALLLDFSRMNRIERIDTLNLVAHIERGVTWDALNAELERLGVKAVAPVAANSLSVAECVSARVVGKAVSKFPKRAPTAGTRTEDPPYPRGTSARTMSSGWSPALRPRSGLSVKPAPVRSTPSMTRMRCLRH